MLILFGQERVVMRGSVVTRGGGVIDCGGRGGGGAAAALRGWRGASPIQCSGRQHPSKSCARPGAK